MCVPGVRSRVPIGKTFSAIAEAQPDGVRYATSKAGDGATLVTLELEKEEEPREMALT
jgi:hypothetical protein